MESKEVTDVTRTLARELGPRIKGTLRLSDHDRMLYATDASIYQVEPLGVVHPATMDEVPEIARFCHERKIALLPRGGGTSLPGQCVNRALVLDYSPTCRRVLEVGEGFCRVEPGIVIDDLNRELSGRGVFFAPDPATAAQCCIGGCIGNNSAGSRSIRYGRTSENLLEMTICLADGRVTTLGPGAGRRDATALELARATAEICRNHAQLIRERFPKTMRRNAGYALDMVLKQLDANVAVEDLDLTGLLCGSEGTLAITLAAKLKLHPLPKAKGLAIVSFLTLEDALTAVPSCLMTRCSAVELIDDVVLEAARGNTQCRRYMDLLSPVEGKPPMAVLYVEYQEASPQAVAERFANLKALLGPTPLACYTDADALSRAWALRKAGEPLLHGLAGHRKPTTCVEDNAVPVENLYRFVEGFKKIVAAHGTRAAYYAHASVGVLHVRPLLDLHDEKDRQNLREIGVEVARWAKECGGVMSGEHGDGRLRGPLLREYFGEELMQAFAQLKRAFDPAGILNPGIIADPGDIGSITQNLRIVPDDRQIAIPQTPTYFDYSRHEGFSGAVEMCNGAGVCRKLAGGTMCPSYRATRDERHATRGRGNALRLAISGQVGKGVPGEKSSWNDPDTLDTLRLCLSCKACKSECPSNVDVAQLKAEYLAQSYRDSGHTPLSARMIGQVRKLNRFASLLPGLANLLVKQKFVRQTMEMALGFDRRRSMPKYAKSLYRQLPQRTSPAPVGRPKVVLFPDCFMTYNEPEIGLASVRVLETLGYEVIVPRTDCCGRSMISTGLLPEAIASADRVLRQLQPYIEDQTVLAVLVAEPSCLSAFKDDYLELKLTTPAPLRQALAAKAMLIEEFVDQRWETHPNPPVRRELAASQVLLHGHCHQKSLWTIQTSAGLLRRLLGDRLKTLDTGCCGMAGAFGFTTDRYELSTQIAEMALLPLVRNAPPDALVVAPGTSCRHQIHDGTGKAALHPMELACRMLVDDQAAAS